ncbi:MAG TPA: alpha/beta hydrolase, partial [Ramlibacter sp.]|nr:alpha/beta hydrolase [Ramlibacter sp.]
LAPYVGPEGVTHLLTIARALKADDVEELDLALIRAPVAIVWGEDQQWLDSGLPERLQGGIAGSTLVRFHGVGTLVPEESPDALVHVVLELLDRQRSPAP